MALTQALCRILLVVLVLLAASSPFSADRARASAIEERAGQPNAQDALLAQIFDDDARREADLDPLDTLYRGIPVPSETLALLFSDTLDRRQLASANESLNELSKIDRRSLSPPARISFDVFLSRKQEQVDWLQPDMRALSGVRPFNHFGGLHVEFPSLMARSGSFQYETEEDYARALSLHAAFAQVLANATLRFRQGMATGVVEPRLTVRNMIIQIDDILSQPPEQSPFYSPVLAFPATVAVDRRQYWRDRYAVSVNRIVWPAYRAFRDFLADEYLAAARSEDGLWAMPGGDRLYRMLIARETSLPLDPDALHQLGLKEVDRIKSEMEDVKAKLGFTGTLPAFFEHIRTNPRYHPQSSQDLSKGFQDISWTVGNKLPGLFSVTPKAGLRIAPFPAFREKFEPGASYYQGSVDGTRNGTFFFNTYDLPSRYLTGITTLYLHEAVPGHHFQISLAQENESLPSFQRYSTNTAFVEGWALYAETLGYDMGLYDDPMQHWGTLDDEMLRAMRLVVDTGIHSRRWTRDEAIRYMLANSGMSGTDASSEVERYIANPAQALAYKVGAMTILRLRHKAQNALGQAFDIRAFHSQVLGSGALPLPVLERKIDAWIDNSRQARSSASAINERVGPMP